MAHPSLNYFQTVHVAKVATDVARITTISAALTAITDNAAAKRYAIIVHPGTYSEKVTMKPYVDLIAAGGREETIISFAATVADEPTLTAENAIIKGFTIIADSTAFRSRCVQAATAGFEMEDCVLTIAAAAGTETCLNATASCDIRDCVIDSAGGSAIGALFTTAAQTYNVYRTNFDSATDAIQITTTPTLNLVNCTVADNLNQDGGTIVVQSGQLEAVALGTAACTFTAEGVRFTAAFATADAFAHTVTCHGCSFSGQNFTNAATGASTITLRACNGIGTLTNAGVADTVNLYDCGIESVNTSQGTMTAYGGRIQACAASAGTSFVWWKDTNHLYVLPTMVVAHALAAAGAGDAIYLGKGTWAESNLTAVNGVDIVGEGPDASIVEATDAVNPIITVGSGVTCVFRGVKVSNLGAGGVIDITAGAAGASLTTRDCILDGDATNPSIAMSTTGIGAPSYVSSLDTHVDGVPAIAVSGAVVGSVQMRQALLITCTTAFTTTGANHTFVIDDTDFATAGVTLTANAPVVTLTRCDDIGTFAHSAACTVTARECYFSGVYTIAAVAGIVNADRCQFSTFTNGGSGAISFEQCTGTDFNNNATSTVAIEGGNWDTVLQGAAAGTINIYGAVIATEIDCSAAGAVNAYDCDIATVDANGGTVTAYGGNLRDVADVTGSVRWWTSRNELTVFAGSVNMVIAQALAAAGAGDTIRITSGTYAESNLTAKNGVDIIGEGSDISVIEATDNANPILNVGTGVTCNIRGVRISNLGTGTTVAVAAGAGAAVLRLQDSDVRGNAAASIVTLTTVGAGAPTLTATNSKFSTGTATIAVTGAVVATVTVDKSVFATCTLVFSTTGANHVFALDDCDFGTGGVTLTANVPVVTLTKCEDIGTFTHSTASTVTLNQCRLSGGYTTGAVAAIVAATGTVFAAVTHGGTGAFVMNNCVAGDIANNSTAAMTLQTCTIGNLTQAAAAGTITANNCVIGNISTGANGTIRLQGSAQFTDIAANAGVLTWKIDPNHIKVVAGTANMKIADALTLAAAGDVIEIYPGTYAESNLTLKASVNIVGTDQEQCLVGMDSVANPIVNAGVTCTLSNLTIFNSNAGNTAATITANILTLYNCYLYGTGAGDAIAMTAGTLTAYDTLVGVGDIDLSTAGCTLSMYRCRLTTDPIDTAGAFAHTLTFEHCEFGGQAIASAATGATTLTMRDCTAVGALTHAGTGAWAIDNSTTGTLTNSSTATVTVRSSTLGNVTQAAAAGTINVTNCAMGDLSTGATGVMRLNGACYFTDIAANAGTLTWLREPNLYRVVAGTANMKIANALAVAVAGDVIEIGPGTYAESNLTLVASVNLVGTDPEQCLIVASDAANPILNAGVTCAISNITIGNTNAGAPAIRVTANTLTLRGCSVYGTGAGDALAMTAGTLIAYDTRVGAGDIDLSTAICTLTLYRCQITTDPIDTAGAFAHVLTLEQCDLGAQNIVSAATLATTLALRGCTNVGTVSNAGTGAFTIRDSDVATITVTNAAGSAVIRGGNVNACGGATGSVTWKVAAQQYQVIAGMSIQHAITAAATDSPAPAATTPYTVLIHPGVYVGTVACSGYVNLRGIERRAVIIQQTDATVIGLASNIQIESLTVRIVTPTAQRYLIGDVGGVRTGIVLQDVEFAYTTPAAIGNLGLLLNGGSTVVLRRCFANWAVPGTGAEIVVSVTTAASTVTIDGCDFNNTNITAGSLISSVSAGTVIRVMNSRLAGTVSHLVASAGIIRVSNSQYRSPVRTGTGVIVDESPNAVPVVFRVLSRAWELTAIANQNIATRTAVGGAVAPGGTGQVRLRINDNALDAAGTESPADAAGALASSFTPAYGPRYVMAFSINAFRATTTAFWGLRAVLGAAVPGAAEHHAGFIWNGANLIASSSNGGGVGQTTNLVTPSTGAHHSLEVAILGGNQVEFYVDGVIVATHSTAAGVPTAVLWFQEYEISTGAGGATTSDITLREGFIQECLV